MHLLVLDKSVVVAAGRGVLSSLRLKGATFLLTYPLLHEILTEGLQATGLPPNESSTRRTEACLERVREAGREWFDNSRSISWEIVHGESSKHGPRALLAETADVLKSSRAKRADFSALIRFDAERGRFASLPHSTDSEREFDKVRMMDKREFFRWLEQVLSSPLFLDTLPTEARGHFSRVALEEGLSVSSSFLPRRDWLTYGVLLSIKAYYAWKFWRVGDGIADPRKPPNPYFDNLYIAFMALSDGIATCDIGMLELSWVCWPEKRENILRYDTVSRELTPFQPGWL